MSRMGMRLLLLAALGLAAASCSQSEAPFAPAGASASPQPAADAGSDASSDASPAASADVAIAAERRASTLIGMPVISAEGSPVGEVKDIVFDRQGRATHLVIEYSPPGSAPGAGPDDGQPPPGAD